MPLDEFSTLFEIPDLHVAIKNFLAHYLYEPQTCSIRGPQRDSGDTQVPFDGVKVWHSIQVQNLSSDGNLRLPQRLFAEPPSDDWPLGRYDTAMFREDIENGPITPGRGFDGESGASIITLPR
jgi:hypothetical protein